MTFSPLRTGDPKIDRNLDAIASAVNPSLSTTKPIVYVPYTAKSPLVVPTDWVTPTLAANFANHSAPNATIQYRIGPDGVVESKGLGKNTAGCANGTTIYTISSGYRPSEDRFFASETNDAFWEFGIVAASGLVYCRAALVANAHFSLQGSFGASLRAPIPPSCFPFDGGLWTLGTSPSCVVAVCGDVSNPAAPSNLSLSLPDWTMSGTIIRVRNIPGLLPSTNYSVSLAAF